MGCTACTEPQCLVKGALCPFTFNVVYLTPHPLLVPWSRKSTAIPLLPLWAVRLVQNLSASTGVHFTLFTFKVVYTRRITLYWPTITYRPMYTRSHINYSTNMFRCSLTTSSGSPVQMQVPWNTSNVYKHSLAARCKVALFNSEYTNFNNQQSLFTDVCVWFLR